ncbi:hypothetical protein DKT68_29265 [Micromonospora acroterricola]|uniref:NACHT domain-containing protein n=1 Tax=Micromonospora acroterricola TaxID=2202421 RepID=A0A317CTY9_9ACTN|nr:NACHT domain-containing protein [Micromonospora acroterricola]PWR04956.1 hypothetical protein DKT68_29265 [Micromonospora acroterricola]
MGQTSPDPGGSASLYQYFLGLLGWMGLGQPRWAPWLFATLVVAGMLLSLAPILHAAAALTGYVKGWLDRRRAPRRVRRRALFADHIESQLRRLDEKEEWRDHRFARLEAEVETEGDQHRVAPRWLYRRRTRLRREKSLSRALQRSDERLIILQGEPGSGKSVALRNAARALASRAMNRPRLNSRIPLYVNLKELRPVEGRLDTETVRAFVLDQLNRANSRDVEQFLSDEFTPGMREGTWLFLFDSFDEIPEILTATELDETVGRYADVLYDFLHGMNVSPGVIASREFKGPRRFGWPRFTVQRLTERQKRELIRKADLESAAEAEVYAALAGADPMVTQLSGNPMLLGLLCEHVRTTGTFPDSSHTVFETFVHSRLERDRERVERRYGVAPGELRQVAEEIAFRLTAEAGMGLSPTRAEVTRLLGGLRIDGQPIGPARLARNLDALEYVKLAQSPEGTSSGDQRPFTFAHRRFQEYFATCVVIRSPDRVPPGTLLLDGRWRETAVAMLQTQGPEAVSLLTGEAGRILAHGVATAGTAIEAAATSTAAAEPPAFEWPPNSLHLLDLLGTGLAGRPEEIPDRVRATVTTLLRAAWASRRRHHQLWAVQATLLAEGPAAEAILEASFATKSVLLRGAAYRYAGRLPALSPRLRRHMRLALIDQAAQGRLLFDWPTVRAQLFRLNDPVPQLRAAHLLRWNPMVTGFLFTLIFVSGAIYQGSGARMTWATGWLAAVTIFGVFWAADMWLTILRARSETAVSWVTDAAVHTGVRLLATFVGIGIALEAPSGATRPAEGHWGWGLTFLVAWCYAVFWPATATATVAWGMHARLRLWPFLPLAFVPAAALAVVRLGWRRQLRAAAWLVVVVAVMPLSLNAQLWLTRHHPHVAAVMPWVPYTLTGVLCVLLVVNYVMCQRVDHRHLRSIPRHRVLDAAALAELTGQLRSDGGLRRLVDLIRRQHVGCTRDSMAVVDELILAAERRRVRVASLPFRRRLLDSLWWQRWERPSAGNISNKTLDELARLIAERADLATTAVGPSPTVTRQRDPGTEVPEPARPA